MNKYQITKMDMLSKRPAIVFGFGNTPEEGIKNCPRRCNEVTLDMEEVLSVELLEENCEAPIYIKRK